MAKVRIPTPLRPTCDGQADVYVDGSSVGQVLENLEAKHPGVGASLRDREGRLQRFVNVFVGSQNIRDADGLETVVGPDDTVTIVPAIAGGWS